VSPGLDLRSTIRSRSQNRTVELRQQYRPWMGRGAFGSRWDARSRAMLMRRVGDVSLAVALGLASIAGMGSPRLMRAHDARNRHPHSVLAPRHGHASRLSIKVSGRDDSTLMRGSAAAPPAEASLVSCAPASIPVVGSGSNVLVRGPPSRETASFRSILFGHSGFRSRPAVHPDLVPSTKPYPWSTPTRLPRRERADRVEGAPARRTPSLAGGDS